MKQWYFLSKEELLSLGIKAIKMSHILYSNKPSEFEYIIQHVNDDIESIILYSMIDVNTYVENLKVDIRRKKIQELL